MTNLLYKLILLVNNIFFKDHSVKHISATGGWGGGDNPDMKRKNTSNWYCL